MGIYLAMLSVVSAQYNRQSDTARVINLPNLEVTAQSHESKTKQTAPLQKIDLTSINRLGIQDVSEAARLFSGVTVRDYGGIGGLKTVSIRSLGAQHTAVGYDGVAITDAQSGQIDISRFTLDNVEMVSLSTGISDDIFQPARIYASAGALHIKTQKPRFDGANSYLFTANLKSGSFGTIHPVLTYGRRLGSHWSASAFADYMHADGEYPFTLVNATLKTREIRLNSDIATTHIEGNAYGDFGAGGGNLETKIYAFHSERGLPGSVNFYNRTATERLWNDNHFFQAHYKNQLNEQLAFQAIGKYSYTFSRYQDVNDKYAAGFQEDRNREYEYYGSAGVLLTPVNGLSASLTTDYAYTQLRNNFLNAVQPRRNTSLTALSAQYKRSALTVTGSLLGAYYSDAVANGDRPTDRKHLSPALAFSWQPFTNNALRIRSSYKDVFRVPTFADLYYLRVGNTGLKPEKARQWNIGLTWNGQLGSTIRYLSLTTDGYYNRIEDKIVALPTLYIWRMMNMGRVEIKGADVTLTAEIPVYHKINATLLCNYTYQYAVDVTNPEAKNYKDQIPYTPRHTGNSAITFETPWVNISYLLTAVGKRYALPQNTIANRVDAYIEQSISLNRTFSFKHVSVRLQGEVLNIADAQYDVIQYYPMPGRSWRLSIAIRVEN